jgi:hypothetical protein
MHGFRSATFREGMAPTLANDPRVIVMLLASASASGSWGLGGFFSVLLNPLWLLFLCCCCCACATAFARYPVFLPYVRIGPDDLCAEHVKPSSTRRSPPEVRSSARATRQALVQGLEAARQDSSRARSMCRPRCFPALRGVQSAPGRALHAHQRLHWSQSSRSFRFFV